MSRWVEFGDLSLPSELLVKPACYVVFGDGRVQYVGSTMNMQRRLSKHGAVRVLYGASTETPWGIFRDFKIKIRYSTKYGDWAMRELRLIRRLKPTQNLAMTGKKYRSRRIVCRD